MPKAPPEGRDLSLWTAVLGAPFLFLSHQLLNYILVQWATESGHRWVLTLISVIFMVLVLGGGLLSLRDYRRWKISSTVPQVDPPLGRVHILAILGMMLAALSFVLILAQAIPTLILPT
jgi:hypothetical protein